MRGPIRAAVAALSVLLWQHCDCTPVVGVNHDVIDGRSDNSSRLSSVLSPRARATANVRNHAQAPGKPNVMLIVADDQGYANIGYHNSTVLTPRIDALARDGELQRLRCSGCVLCIVVRTTHVHAPRDIQDVLRRRTRSVSCSLHLATTIMAKMPARLILSLRQSIIES